MTSLISSAEELLKTRTIPELRELVSSLENDGNSKITELQVMVGSKYHDFIQSADAIAAMGQKSEFLEANLNGFLKLSQDVVAKTRELLERTLNDKEKQDKGLLRARAPLKLYKAVNSQIVWGYLEECDIFGAAKVVVQSKLLLEACSYGSEVTVSSLSFPTFFSASALKGLREGSIHSAALLQGCSSVVFLSQTVLDDARLFLLEGSCTSEEKARTLAAVGLLTPRDMSGNGKSKMHRGDLLTMYLEGADVMLDTAIEGLNTHSGKNRGETALTGAARMGEKLIEAVQTLQQTILDVHFLFFKPAEVSVLNNTTTVAGLILVHQLEFIRDIERALLPLLPTADKMGLGFDQNAFLADDSPLEVKKVFDQWIERAVQRVGERARSALEAMTSATEVARLQQRVWLCCTTVTVNAPAVPMPSSVAPSSVGYIQVDWEEACMSLLAVKRRRERAVPPPGSQDAAAASLLWSRMFRLPFMLQVERLLRESCTEVLQGARGMLLQALAQEGVEVDPVTLFASLATPIGRNGTAIGANGVDNSLSFSFEFTPSPRIFRRAEAVRSLLQEEFSDLLRDIVVPVQEGDPESSTGLKRALFIQCSQLSGQIAILLRSLCLSLTRAIDMNLKAASKSSSYTEGSDEKLTLQSRGMNAPLLSGLLLVGRLSWLLKIRGRFLEEALAHSPAPSSSAVSNQSTVALSYDLVSEDQMRSAFEIADTNGDGVLTYSEAIEAVNALAVSDAESYGASGRSKNNSNGDDQSTNIPFLSGRFTPSLNFNEFALLCAHLMSPLACCPVERLKSCFDETLSTCHTLWAERVVLTLAPSLSSSLATELGNIVDNVKSVAINGSDLMSQGRTQHNSTQMAPFRSTWKQEWVELDYDNDNDSDERHREQVSIPTLACTSLSAFLFTLSHSIACSLLSVDTVQQLPPVDIFPPSPLPKESYGDREMEKDPVNRIALHASTVLYSIALTTIANTYSTLLRDSGSSSSQPGDEDVALQALFDLMVCDSLADRCGLAVPKTLRICMAGWRARLDPINAEILVPLLVTASEQFSSKSHLLLPGLRQPKEITTPTPIDLTSSTPLASDSNATAIFGLFPPTPACRFSLLPLPMSTHFQGAFWVDRDRERDRDRTFQNLDKQQEEPSMFAAKNLLSGLSLSQQQQNAEQLGKSLISQWGSFLGQAQANKD